MKSGIKQFILKIEHSARTLLVHSLITLFRLLFFFRYLASGNTFVDLHYQLQAGRKNNMELRHESLQCIVGPVGRRTASVSDRGDVAS